VDGESGQRKAGYFGQHLRPYLEKDSLALKYLNGYKSHQTFKLITSITTIVSFSAFAISNLSKESVSQENLDAPDKGKGMLIVAIGSAVTNIIIRAVGTKSLDKAVETHNRPLSSLNFKLRNIGLDFKMMANKPSPGVHVRFSVN
jgi:hypothetical protein